MKKRCRLPVIYVEPKYKSSSVYEKRLMVSAAMERQDLKCIGNRFRQDTYNLRDATKFWEIVNTMVRVVWRKKRDAKK